MRQVLKYPGSKWNVAKELINILPAHKSYVEPYFGSGALFFTKKPAAIETINDLDNEVINLFSCIKEDAQQLARLVAVTPYSREVYDSQYEPTKEYTDNFERAAGFLIKCWQGQGFRTNQYMAGWKSDVQGRESMYSLWNWYRLPAWILEIAERLRMVQIENRPALEVIRRFDYPDVLQYLDPPYMPSVRAGKQYSHEMNEEAHEELLQTIVKSKAKIIISGYDNPLYNSYLSGWEKLSFKGNAQYGKERTEVCWMNFRTKARQLTLFDL